MTNFKTLCHCEKRSDEAIFDEKKDCFAPSGLAMTRHKAHLIQPGGGGTISIFRPSLYSFTRPWLSPELDLAHGITAHAE